MRFRVSHSELTGYEGNVVTEPASFSEVCSAAEVSWPGERSEVLVWARLNPS